MELANSYRNGIANSEQHVHIVSSALSPVVLRGGTFSRESIGADQRTIRGSIFGRLSRDGITRKGLVCDSSPQEGNLAGTGETPLTAV